MYWWTDEGETIFSLVDTSTLSMKSEVAGIVVRDKNGKVVPSPPPMEQHHLGFRFFRYSQVSEDLFGAYRNMYLPFVIKTSERQGTRSAMAVTSP